MCLDVDDVGFGSFSVPSASQGNVAVPLPPPLDEPQRVAVVQSQVNELWKWVDLVKRVHRDANSLEQSVRSRWVSAQASLDGYRRALAAHVDVDQSR